MENNFQLRRNMQRSKEAIRYGGLFRRLCSTRYKWNRKHKAGCRRFRGGLTGMISWERVVTFEFAPFDSRSSFRLRSASRERRNGPLREPLAEVAAGTSSPVVGSRPRRRPPGRDRGRRLRFIRAPERGSIKNTVYPSVWTLRTSPVVLTDEANVSTMSYCDI